MLKPKHSYSLVLVFLCTLLSCSTSQNNDEVNNPETEINPGELEETELTIFFVNDQHGQLDNFSKIKHIVDNEKLTNKNVILACSGDIFSGNPVVDFYSEKGYPMIDIMNQVGFDIAVLGNHEYDYGESILADRIIQSEFDWICANVDMNNTGIPEPAEYSTIKLDNLNITFLGLVETNGKENGTIPSTHPDRVKNISFQRPENTVAKYANIKETENSDLYIALTHLGNNGGSYYLGDKQLAEQFPYFDLIIGGHSHQQVNTLYNNIPVFQSGSFLNHLGQINITVKNKEIINIDYDLIDLNDYNEFDKTIKDKIDTYNNSSQLTDVIGVSNANHEIPNVGCMYTEILKKYGNVDIVIQNTGGIRNTLDKGDITKREIFEIDPFGNKFKIINMSVKDIKLFLKMTGDTFFYSGVKISQNQQDIIISNLNGLKLEDNTILSLGINDYIPAVYDTYFKNTGITQPLTTAESIIDYLKNNQETTINYSDCVLYFRYQ